MRGHLQGHETGPPLCLGGVNPKNPIYLLKPILEVDGVIGLNSFLQKGALESTFLNIPDHK